MRSSARKRVWVKKHAKNLTQLTKEIHKRLTVLKKHVWIDGEDEPFEWWASGLLGVLPMELAIKRAMAACLVSAKATESVLALICANNVVSHLNRIGRARDNVVLYLSPSVIPTGYIHLLDLTPKELGSRLATATKKHGVRTLHRMLSEFAKTTPELPEVGHGGTKGVLSHKAQARKHALLGQLEDLSGACGGQSADLSAAKRRELDKLFTPEAEKIVEKRLGELSKAYKTKMPGGGNAYAEQLKSLAAGHSPSGMTPTQYMQDMLLKLTQGQLDFGAVPLSAIAGFNNRRLPARKDPDEIYRRCTAVGNRRKRIQAICSKFRNPAAALKECRTEYPDISMADMEHDCEYPGEYVSQALDEVSEELKTGHAYILKLYKRGRLTANVNEIWDQYMSRFCPQPKPVTPENFPEHPPIRIARSR